jgi:hypothetical protein
VLRERGAVTADRSLRIVSLRIVSLRIVSLRMVSLRIVSLRIARAVTRLRPTMVSS